MLLTCIGYASDWAIWRIRGSAMDAIEVSQVSVASMKGNKEEYFSDGTETVACSRSLLPMQVTDGWTAPCWWLRRHAQVVERY